MGLIYCAGGRAPHFPDPFRQIATAILLKRSKKWPCSPTLLATIAQVRQPPRPGFDLPRKGHSAPMDAVTGVAAGFVCARRQGKIRIRPGRGRSTEPPSLITESGDEALASRRFGRVRIAIPVAVLAATVAAGWHQVAAIDLLRVSETLHLVPLVPVLGIQLLALLAILAMRPYDLLIAPVLGIRRGWCAWVHDAWIANTFNNMLGLAGLTGSGLRYLLAGRDHLSHRQAAGQAAPPLSGESAGVSPSQQALLVCISILDWPLAPDP